MLSSELNPEQDSLTFIKAFELNHDDAEEQIKELRHLLSNNVIVTGWIRHPGEQSVEDLVDKLRNRVTKFETHQHLRIIQADTGTSVKAPS